MRLLVPLFALALLAGCKSSTDASALSLMFSTYWSTPVVLTHFSIEMPLGPVPEFIPGGRADRGPPRNAGSSVGGVPLDAGDDGLWRVSARWVELTTDHAWEAEVDVPIEELNLNFSHYALNVIMGPNGLLLIGSDKAGEGLSGIKDVARICGHRVPSDDKAWRLTAGELPGLSIIMKNDRPPVTNSECLSPQE